MKRVSLGLEFFPPNRETEYPPLLQVFQVLSVLSPEMISVTYGAGGSTQARTLRLVETLQNNDLPAMIVPHLTTVGARRRHLQALLADYQRLGIRGILALRGDTPSGMADDTQALSVVELIALIRQQLGAAVQVSVAAYPEIHPLAASPQADVAALKAKADAGANQAITQFFYNIDSYLRLRDELAALGCDLPLIAGIMPITTGEQLMRFADNCGTEIPRWIGQRLLAYQQQPQALQAFGEEVVSTLCQRLIEQEAPGLHIYTMNRAAPTLAIAERLGWISKSQNSELPNSDIN